MTKPTLKTLTHQLPIFALLAISGLAIAHGTGTGGRVIPYVGFLEENGVPAEGPHDIDVTLYAAPIGGAPCMGVQEFTGHPVSAGRFQVDLANIADGCLRSNALWLEVSVDGTALTASPDPVTGSERVRLGPTPLATALAGDPVVQGTMTVSTGGSSRRGTEFHWNMTGGLGETDFVNLNGNGPGGFRFYTADSVDVPPTYLAQLNAAGTLSLAGSVAANGDLAGQNLDVAGTVEADHVSAASMSTDSLDIGYEVTSCTSTRSSTWAGITLSNILSDSGRRIRCPCPDGKRVVTGGVRCPGSNPVGVSTPINEAKAWEGTCLAQACVANPDNVLCSFSTTLAPTSADLVCANM